MSRALATILLCVGCRYGFNDRTLEVLDGPIDAPFDAAVAIKTITFGERTGSMNTGVTDDTHIAEQTFALNFELDEALSVDGGIGTRERALIRFDVASIAPGTQVLGARVSLVMIDFGDQMDGALAARLPGEAWSDAAATWDNRMVAIAWTTGGGSLVASPVATFTPGEADAVIALPPGVVQAWVDAPSQNAGVAIVCADEALDTHYHFHSADSTQTANRPLLQIDIPM